MTVTTAASPPAAATLGDLWYDTGNGNLRNECTETITWADGSGWTGSAATAAVTANTWPGGIPALLLTADGTGDWLGASQVQTVSPGQTVSAAGQVFVPAAFDGTAPPLALAALSIMWLDGTGTPISTVTGSTASVAVNASALLPVTGTAPADAASFKVQAGDAESSPAGTQMLVANVTASTWAPYQISTDAIADGAITAGKIAGSGSGNVTLTTTPVIPSTPSDGCVIYYRSGQLWVIGTSGVPVSLATT